MTRTEILERIKQLAVANGLMYKNEAETVTDDTTTVTYLDSLDQIELCMLLEKEYGISISKQKCESISTFGGLVSLVEKKTK